MSIDTSTQIYGSTVTYFINLLRTNLTDVTNPTAVGTFNSARANTTTWVVANFPQPKKYGNFPGYPLVIVESPEVEESQFALRNVKQNDGVITFRILDKNSTPVNADKIAGQIKHIINNHWTSTAAQGIARMTARSVPLLPATDGDDTIVRRVEYDVVYRTMDNYC